MKFSKTDVNIFPLILCLIEAIHFCNICHKTMFVVWFSLSVTVIVSEKFWLEVDIAKPRPINRPNLATKLKQKITE